MPKSKLSKEQIISMVEEYKSGLLTIQELGQKYGIVPTAILGLLKRRHIDTSKRYRRYTLDDTFFDKIDTEEKAYILGLLYADGYNNEEKGAIRISLQKEDVHILEQINNIVGSNRPIKDYVKGGNRKLQARLDINSLHLSKKLSELGCFQAKSLTLKFPTSEQVPPNLIRHFIRGYFDGDGGISFGPLKRGGNYYKISITSSIYFNNFLSDFIINEIKVNNHIQVEKRFGSKTSTITINGGKNAEKFLHWIYDGASIFLNRKHEKYLLIKGRSKRGA